MEVAKNPTDKNISMWFKYIEIKNKLATRLQKRMSEYLAKRPGTQIPKATKRGLEFKKSSISKVDPKRFRIRMYFESTCPHCKRMMMTLKSLQEEGYFVEAYQIDSEKISKNLFPIATAKAGPSDVKKYNITSVPFTLVADLKSKRVSKPVKGYQSVNQMKNILSLMKTKSKVDGGRI